MLQEYLVELGLNAAKNKGVEAIKQHNIKKALEDYFQRKFRDNYNCTKEEKVYQVRAYCDIRNVPSHRLWLKNKFAISPVKMPDNTIAGSFVSYVLQ